MSGNVEDRKAWNLNNINSGIQYAIFALFLLSFLPILFCVIVFGAGLDYQEVCKLATLVSNKVLFLVAVIAIMVFTGVYYVLERVRIPGSISVSRSRFWTKWGTVAVAGALFAAFTAVYFLNVEICKCIWMEQGWDVKCVVEGARALAHSVPIGEEQYFAIYSNNVPITYFMALLYDKAERMANYPYPYDFIWIQVICAMISVAGFVMCMAVRKMLRKPAAVLAAFFLYIGCVCATPWKTAPYTDMFAVLFPVLCLSIYVFCCHEKRSVKKCLLWVLILVSAIAGALVKPTVLVVLIAIVVMEILQDVTHLRKQWKLLSIKICLLVAAGVLLTASKNYIYEEAGYSVNENAAVTYHHYLLMGLNEETTGGYHPDVLAFHGKFATPKERIPAQWEAIGEELAAKGVWGYLDFIKRKMVMTFNDGAFGWGREGDFSYDAYPVLTDASYAVFLRDVFWPDFLYSGRFNTYSQLVWLLMLCTIPGLCLVDKNNRHLAVTMALSILGIILYLMLFEARSRYLLCFLPLFVMAAAIGLLQYCRLLNKWAVPLLRRAIMYLTKKKK